MLASELLEKHWRRGRKFTVAKNILVGRVVLMPGVRYRVALNTKKAIIAPDVKDPLPLRLSERKVLIASVKWIDERISEPLKLLIQSNPESKYIRGFLRQELGVVPEPDKTPKKAEEWFDFIKKIPDDVIPDDAKGDDDVTFKVGLVERVKCQRIFYRRDYWGGEIDVPLETVREGVSAIRDYIYDNASEVLDRSAGGGDDDEDDYLSDEIIESEGMELVEHNIESVAERLPEAIRREMHENEHGG